MAPQLDLVVCAADEMGAAVRVPVGEIARLIHPRVAGSAWERAGEEALGGQLGIVQVTARHLNPAYVQLANLARCRGPSRGGEDVKSGAVHRHADRHRSGVGVQCHPIDRAGGGVDRALRRSVQVDQLAGRQRKQAAPRQALRQRLTAAEDLGQRAGLRQLPAVQDRLQQRRYALQRRDAVLGDHLQHPLRVPVHTGAAHDDPGTAAVGEDLPLRGVEAHRGLLQDDGRRTQAVSGLQPSHLADDAAVLDHHPLGPAGAARGVDDVREVARVRPRKILACEAGTPALSRLGHADHHGARRRQLGDSLLQALPAQNDPGPAVLDHVP